MIGVRQRLRRAASQPRVLAGLQSLGVRAARLRTLPDLVAVTALTLGIGYAGGALRGFPVGNDALGHLSKVRQIVQAWPHFNWNDDWYAGLPNFTGSYPPGYHLLVAGLVKAGAASATTAMLVVTGLSLVLLTLGSYGFVRLATHSRVVAWLAVLLVLAEPTLWSQSLQFGLYPRLLSLGLGAASLPAAVLYARRPSRLAGAALVLLTAAALSAHPFVGVAMGCFAAGTVVILGDGPSLRARAKRLVAPAILLVLLVSYFYVPLVFLSQGQSAATFVNRMPYPVPWGSLVWPHGAWFEYLVSWSPVTLPLIVAAAGVAWLTLRRPSARVTTWSDGTYRAQELDRFLTEVGRAGEARRRYRPLLLLAAWSGFLGALFLAYCVLQHVTATFPYYVNGLYPNALLVYAALFGVLGSAIALTPLARRRAGAVSLLVVGAAAAGLLGVYLPGHAYNFDNAGRHQIERMVQQHVPTQHVYRIADGDPDMALALNAYTRTPQTDGYQPQGDLHQAWQTWLEEAILGQGQNRLTRRFLFDWYAAEWVLVHDGAPYERDPSHYRLVEQRTSIAPTSLWEIRTPTPIFTAVKTPPLLFVGNALHYDLLLHALAADNVNSSELIPVQGGSSLAGYTLDELRSYREIVLWGSPVGAHGVRLLDEYVRGGGRVFVDEGEANPLFPASSEPVGPFAKKTISRPWTFADPEPDLLHPALLHRLPQPNYAGTGHWQITYPVRLPANATALARSHGHVVLAAIRKGKGTLVWSGLNVPYLASSTHSSAAARLLADLATGTPAPRVEALGAVGTRLNPEHWQFLAPAGATALLVRQYTSVDWHASNAATGAPLSIRPAGPGMTLVLIPRSRTATTIKLEYTLSQPEQTGLWLSGFGVLALLFYAAGFRLPREIPRGPGRSRSRGFRARWRRR